MDAPIQFVSTGPSGSELIILQDAIKKIQSELRPVTVVSIIGPYRTGKSYLLNRLMGKANGFELGPTMEAKTKGIWLWVGDFPGQPKRSLVLLDVEGLSDAKKGDASHDLNLFVFALLASSVFIYNTKGTIDANALDGLHLATRIGDELLSNGEEEQTFAQYFPDFIWAIRDHHLKLEIDGRPVTANEYLDNCLKPKKGGFGAKTTAYNALRGAIRNFFPNRDCFVFPPPTHDMEKMNILDQISDADLAPEFKMAADNFVTFVMNHAKPKLVKGTEISGPAFAAMMTNFLESLLKKQINIQSTYSFVVNAENRRALEMALENCRKVLSAEMPSLPVSTETFTRVAEKAMTTSNKIFLEACINIQDKESQKFLEELNASIKDQLISKGKENANISRSKCKKILNELFEPVEANMNSAFIVPGGFSKLKPEIDKLKMTYLEMSLTEEFGPCKGQVLKQFEDEKLNPALERVLATDQQLSEMAKREEKLKIEKEQSDEEAKRMQEETEKLREAQAHMEEAHEKNMEQVMETIHRQHEQDLELAKKQIQNEMKEMQRMQEVNQRDMAQRHQETINCLQRDMAEARARADRAQQEAAMAMKQENARSQSNMWSTIVKGVVDVVKVFANKPTTCTTVPKGPIAQGPLVPGGPVANK